MGTKYLIQSFLLLGMIFLPLYSQGQSKVIRKAESTSFYIAGHAYGQSRASTVGIYPPLYSYLKQHPADFIVYAGDFVRRCDKHSLSAFEQQMKKLEYQYYLALGNHDYGRPCKDLITKKWGNLHYSVQLKNVLLLFLNSQESFPNIAAKQLHMVDAQIKDSTSQIVFLFLHELLWLDNRWKHRGVSGNGFSRYPYLKNGNFRKLLLPLLQSYSNKQIYVIAGDTGHAGKSIPAYWEKLANVTLLATGMGNGIDDNILGVEINKGQVEVRLIPLNDTTMLQPITEHSANHYRSYLPLYVDEYLWLMSLLVGALYLTFRIRR